jgi:hypothetical protein
MNTRMSVSETLEILGAEDPYALLTNEDAYAYLYATKRLEDACKRQGFNFNNYCTEVAASLRWA